MPEYTDKKHRRHIVTETVREPFLPKDGSREAKETRESREQEIVEALFRIFQLTEKER